TPRLELGYFDRQYYIAPPSITHNGFLYKTASMGKPITEKKSREEFSKRWCVLDNGLLSYYESDRNSTPNGTIEMREVVCLSINSPAAHGTLYIQAERKLDFIGWNSLIQRAAASAGNTLSEQQLTDEDIPVIVDRCIAYVTQYGLTSEGIYRKSGQKSKTTSLLEMFLKDARSVRLREGEHQVDDVSNTLKRLFRESIGESVFTDQVYQDWLHASMIPEEKQKILQYQKLFMCLPKVNRATLKALINHLYCVQRLSDKNQMTVHNLAIVFGPTLFQMDGQDNKAGRVVEDLINHFIDLFNVDEQQIKKQLDEIVSIIKLRDACLVQSSQNAGDFICTVYLEEKKPECELSLKVPAAMTAQELTEEILYLRKLITKEKDNWCCFEVIERDEMGQFQPFA
ncbi:hypothetical protein chiPu_0021207, partial [Chiloscyllium punctatum]|nr:hypothetical protein [Chiloscyllium punctatum]